MAPCALAGLLACGATPVPGRPLEFELAVGERVTLQDGSASIEFLRVTDESRCPSDVTCVWAGDARVALRLNGSPGTVDTALHTTTPERSLTHGDYVLELLDLIPAPVSTAPIDPGTYRVRLRLSVRE
jgi:hypothetical protein